MYQTKFNYTPKIVNFIASIERLYGQLISEKVIPSLSLSLQQQNQILATHYSTSIEGNPLTPKEVTNILLGDTIPTTKSENEVKNYFNALNYISVQAKQYKPITMKLVLNLHRLVMQGVEVKKPGQFRDQPVIIGHKNMSGLVIKHSPPVYSVNTIKQRLQELFTSLREPSDINPWIQAGALHHEVAYIHPFFDGNGRVTRLLTAYYLLLKGYEISKYFILDDYYDIDRLEYSDKLHSADKGDKTEWLEYFLEGASHSLKSAYERIKELTERQLESIKGSKRVLVTPREEDVLQILIELRQIKSQDVVKHLQISRQQAHALLASLVDKDIIEKIGKTKSSYYQLKNKNIK